MPSKAVLFDFDGTFADTAVDLSRALNRLRTARGLAELPLETLRPHASSGARGLIGAGLGILPEHPEFNVLRETFLKHYAAEICVDTHLFPGMDELLTALEARGLRWGIVTNKSTILTRLLVKALNLDMRAACVVCGDTTPFLKPNPASLLYAANEIKFPPADCHSDLGRCGRQNPTPLPGCSRRYARRSRHHWTQAASMADVAAASRAGPAPLIRTQGFPSRLR